MFQYLFTSQELLIYVAKEIITVAVQKFVVAVQVIMLPTRDDLLHHDSLEGSRDFWSLTLPKGIKIIRRSSIHRKVGRKQLVGFVLSFRKKALKPLQKNI